MLSLKRLFKRGARAKNHICTVLAGLAVMPALSYAALPGSQAPSRGEGTTYAETIKNYGYDGFMLFGLFLCACALTVVAIHGIGVYHEIHIGKKTWKDLGATIIVGVLLIGLVIFIVTKATGIM
ncbi:TIGR03745 family integrating conjugative element membrane protein [Pseudomonas oryzihabitans]|uniref:TIGR03745 family integrating conjugative element membrane protein n=1 Tax=Pseudomonas oryzihabitans TaxID=47885 RepID=UPI003F99F0B9